MEDYYVYAYLDPMKPLTWNHGVIDFNYEPFYIGRGRGNRVYEHLGHSLKCKRNALKYNKIQKIRRQGHEPIVVFINTNLSRQEANSIEIDLISFFGTIVQLESVTPGPLANLTLGGEGRPVWSEDARRAMSLLKTGYSHTTETKTKLREAKLGTKLSNETKAKISKTSTGRRLSDDTRKKISAAHKSVPKKASQIDKMKLYRPSEESKNKSSNTKSKIVWIVEDSSGIIHEIVNFKKWCLHNKLCRVTLSTRFKDDNPNFYKGFRVISTRCRTHKDM